MQTCLKKLIHLPSTLWEACFPPTVRHVESMIVVCPSRTQIKDLPQAFGTTEKVQYAVNNRVTVNNRSFRLDDNEIAVIISHRAWWKTSPQISINIYSS